MRRSRRARVLLAGMLGIALVGAAAAFGGLSATASAAVSAPAAASSHASVTAHTVRQLADGDCYGASCDGLGPGTEGCNIGAETIFGHSYPNLYKTDGVWHEETITLDFRYSPSCRSVWALISANGAPDGSLFWPYNRGTGKRYNSNFTSQFQRSRMVGDAGTKSEVCVVTVPNPDHVVATTNCLGWF